MGEGGPKFDYKLLYEIYKSSIKKKAGLGM